MPVYSADLEMIRRLALRGADINARDNENNTPLHQAASAGNVARVEFFLEQGMDINDGGSADYSPLQLAARYGHVELARFLIQGGANVNLRQRVPNGNAPLHTASWRGDTAVALLLAHGAPINVRNDTHETPLHVAALCGQTEVVELFLSHGATVNATDNKGKTPLQYAVERGFKETADLLRQHGATES